ncbi:MCE family protein [Aeromicrobium sp. 50.2.37]|uniref:MCE family protein n=1 Tax=Aeromicrobium sp. 50.2.37 TaxID=2969305 RepID=UPI00215065E4|nr:MCE family protein [Aeromicrobium sp. 50.2.37]MCR4514777.1 MCE family protein [Aeromicrobium sp. 50.2.37]
MDLTTIDPDDPGRAVLVRRGLVLVVLLVLVGAALAAVSRGALADDTTAHALVDDAGGSLVPGSDVKLDGVIVGRVTSITQEPVTTADGGDPSVRIDLRIDERHARGVPAQVTARVLPATVFGTTYVDLVRPRSERGALRAGSAIEQARDAETLELQDTLDSSYRILTAVEPAELSATLGALATALDGRGEQLGGTIETVSGYLGRLEPRLPLLREDLQLFAQNMTTLAETSPQLLDATRNALVTSRTIVQKRAQLTTLISGSNALVGEGRRALDAVGDPFVEALDGAAVVVDAMYDERAGLPDSFTSFVDFAAKQAETFSQGSYMSTNVFIKTGDDAPYTASDCPTYGTARGPRCGGSPGSTDSGTSAATPDDDALVAELRGMLDALEAAPQGGVAELLGRPYLEGGDR